MSSEFDQPSLRIATRPRHLLTGALAHTVHGAMAAFQSDAFQNDAFQTKVDALWDAVSLTFVAVVYTALITVVDALVSSWSWRWKVGYAGASVILGAAEARRPACITPGSSGNRAWRTVKQQEKFGLGTGYGGVVNPRRSSKVVAFTVDCCLLANNGPIRADEGSGTAP